MLDIILYGQIYLTVQVTRMGIDAKKHRSQSAGVAY